MKNRDKETEKEEKVKKILLLGVVLTLVAVLAVPMAASAATANHTSTVSGQVTATYTIEVPDNVSLGGLSNSTDATSASQTITVNTNDTGASGLHHVTVAVKGVDGKLSSGSTSLTPVLTITSPTIGWTNTNIGAADAPGAETLDATTGSAQATDVTIKQPAVTTPNPVPAGTYQEILTFTATFGS